MLHCFPQMAWWYPRGKCRSRRVWRWRYRRSKPAVFICCMWGKLLFDLEVKLLFLWFCPRLEDADIGRLLTTDLQLLSELVVDFEIGGGDDLEDGVAVVLEIEQIFVGLVFGSSICEALSSQETDIAALVLWFETTQENPLTVTQEVVLLVFWHGYVYLNIIYNHFHTTPAASFWIILPNIQMHRDYKKDNTVWLLEIGLIRKNAFCCCDCAMIQ